MGKKKVRPGSGDFGGEKTGIFDAETSFMYVGFERYMKRILRVCLW